MTHWCSLLVHHLTGGAFEAVEIQNIIFTGHTTLLEKAMKKLLDIGKCKANSKISLAIKFCRSAPGRRAGTHHACLVLRQVHFDI
jgi:hypothetical protein